MFNFKNDQKRLVNRCLTLPFDAGAMANDDFKQSAVSLFSPHLHCSGINPWDVTISAHISAMTNFAVHLRIQSV